MAQFPSPHRAATPIRKSNAFATAGYSLSLGGHRLVGCALAALTMDQSLFPYVVISSELVKRVFPRLQSQNAYTAQMHKATTDAKALEVQLFDDDFADLASISVFNRIDFIAGTFLFSFHPDVRPQVVELTRNYTSLTLQDLGPLRTEAQFRLFEIARSFLWQGSKEISIENLRNALGIKEKEYPSAGHFMSRVILPSIEAINEHTRLTIRAEPVKHSSSHKILSVRFTVHERGMRPLTAEDHKLVAALQDLKISESRAAEIVTQHDPASIQSSVQSVKARMVEGNVTNPAGLLMTKLTGGARSLNSIEALQPNWTQTVASALTFYRSKPHTERESLDRGFKAWAADKRRQMFSYIEMFEQFGIEHPFIAQLMTLYIQTTRLGNKTQKPIADRSVQLALASKGAGQVELFAA